MIFMNFARGIRAWDKTEIKADRYPMVVVMLEMALLWYLHIVKLYIPYFHRSIRCKLSSS